MKHTRTPYGRWFALAALAVSLSRCNSGGTSSDGSSSWLNDCNDDSDCRGNTTCHCGVCTSACKSSSDCRGMPSESTCVETAERGGSDCRVGVFAQGGVCLPPCSGMTVGGSHFEGTCPEGLRCESGVCIPNTVAIGDDAGVVQRPDGGESDGTGGASSGGSGGIDTGGAASGGTASGGTTAASGGKGAGASPALPSGPVNAYGGPVEVASAFPAMCPKGPYLSEEGLCVTFNTCRYDCQHDVECPSVAGSNARPVCGWDKYCQLLCDGDNVCPAGMTCTENHLGRFCAWQTAPTAPCSFDDSCRALPRPAFCAKPCAEEAVACDDSLGVTCCEGFVCGPDHFCVKGGN